MNKKFNYFCLTSLLFIFPCLQPSSGPLSTPTEQLLTIHNDSNQKMFAAIYRLDEQAQRTALRVLGGESMPDIAIEPHSSIVIVRPKKIVKTAGNLLQPIVYFPQQLLITHDEDILIPTLATKIIEAGTLFGSIRIEDQDSDFTITHTEHGLEISKTQQQVPSLYNYLHTSISHLTQALSRGLQSATTTLQDQLKPFVQTIKSSFEDHAFTHQTAHVTVGNSLSNAEHDSIVQRLLLVAKAVSLLLKESVTQEEVPRIALCCSGGGYRAMLGTLGALDYLQEKELLNLCTHMIGLSGSTWAFAGLIHAQMPIKKYIQQLTPHLQRPLTDMSQKEQILIGKELIKQYSLGNKLSLIDIYGALLGQKMLSITGKDPTTCTLPDQGALAAQQQLPIPVYTAIVDNQTRSTLGQKKYRYSWCELSPYSSCLLNIIDQKREHLSSPFPLTNAAIPTWAFGRKFKEGISISSSPPPSTGFIMGICGSAISVNIQEVYKKLNPLLPSAVAQFLHSKGMHEEFAIAAADFIKTQIIDEKIVDDALQRYAAISQKRALPAQVPNWVFAMPALEYDTLSHITLIDAGIDFNFPVPSALRTQRGINIIIMFDLGNNGEDLKQAEQYAKKHGLKFPRIPETYQDMLAKETCVLFQEHDPTTPIIVYIQLLKAHPKFQKGKPCLEEPFAATSNVQYSPEQVSTITHLAAFNMRDSIPLIKKTIQAWVTRRRAYLAEQMKGTQGDTKRSAATAGGTP